MNMKLLAGQIVGLFVFFALALLLPAGTPAWPAGWVFLVLFFGFVIALSLWLIRHNPELLAERMRGTIQSRQKSWDKVMTILLNVIFLAWLIVMPLDAVRFHWSQVPVWLQVLGAALLVCSFYLFFLTFRENSYLSPIVRIQSERGHTVVSSGPYHYVRHPMYSGVIFFASGTALLLGSYYGLLVGLILVIAVARRAILEERTLREELHGYDAYMTQVKYRLIPYVW